MAADIASWPLDEGECRAWCSAPSVTDQDVIAWSDEASTEAWVLVDDRGPVAYGEIWVDHDESEVELAHLIVAPPRRRTGCGRQLVEALSQLAVGSYPTVVMRVRPDNVAAQRCYASAGFARVDPSDEAAWNMGQPVAYVWMQLAGPG